MNQSQTDLQFIGHPTNLQTVKTIDNPVCNTCLFIANHGGLKFS